VIRAIKFACQGDAQRLGSRSCVQLGILIDVCISCQHINGDFCIFVSCAAVIIRYRCIVHLCDCHGNKSLVLAVSVCDEVFEGICSVVVCIWCVDDFAIHDGDAAVIRRIEHACQGEAKHLSTRSRVQLSILIEVCISC